MDTDAGPLRIIVDSASNVSIMRPDVNLKYVTHTEDMNLVAFGTNVRCREVATIAPFNAFRGLLKEMRFVVYPFHNYFHALIGVDIIDLLGGIIDIKNCKFKFGNKFVPLFLKREDLIAHESYFSQVPDDLGTFNIDMKKNPYEFQDLNEEEKRNVLHLLRDYSDLFWTKDKPLTFTNRITHRINTVDDRPTYSNSYRYPAAFREEVDNQINDLLTQGVIRPSRSPYNSPLWIVPKKDDSMGNKQFRLVVDYRKLNIETINSQFL